MLHEKFDLMFNIILAHAIVKQQTYLKDIVGLVSNSDCALSTGHFLRINDQLERVDGPWLKLGSLTLASH